jgi:hypothetical protein
LICKGWIVADVFEIFYFVSLKYLKMTSGQIDYLSMFYETDHTCFLFQTVWDADLVFKASYNAFKGKIPLIEQNRDTQLTPTKWATLDRGEKKTVVEEKTLFLINRLQSYANATGDKELLSSISFTPSDLKRLRGANLIGTCNMIVTKAQEKLSGLIIYGINQEVIIDLQAAITAFADSLTTPGSAKSNTKVATENLAALFKEAEEILTKRLDLDIEMYKTSHPDFYSRYQTARMVISNSGRSVMLLCHVEDADSGEPLKNATFTFTLQGDTTVTLVKKSAEKGNLRVPSLNEGIYIVTIEKIGYIPQQQTVTIVKGETSYLEVKLSKI